MPYSEILADRIRELLADIPKVQEKKMFRGVTFMVNKKMCVSVSLDRLMCRVDPQIHESLVEKDGCQTVNMRGHDLKGWVYVDEDVLKTEKALKFWVGLALDFNKEAKASVKKQKAKSIKHKAGIEKQKAQSKKPKAGNAKKRKK